MAFYTTEVRHICEVYAGLDESADRLGVNEVITKALPKIFDFSFPIFNENYRTTLEEKIIRHYYTREIGEETVGLWKLRLETRLNEIMPYYNKLYNSELLNFDPLRDVDLTTDHSGEMESNTTESASGNVTTNNTTNSTRNAETEDAYSDTPQGKLSGVKNDIYLTQFRDTKVNDTGTRTDSGTTATTGSNTGNKVGTDVYTNHVYGKSAGTSFAKLISEYRKLFLNIDMMIIDELSDLFMNIWA